MIRVNDDWVIDVDEYNYILKKDMHRSRERVRKDGTPYIEDDYTVKGYFSTLERALNRLGEEMVRERLKDGAHDLREATQAIRECTGKFVLMRNSVLAEEQEGRA